jgi:hypothetical protein
MLSTIAQHCCSAPVAQHCLLYAYGSAQDAVRVSYQGIPFSYCSFNNELGNIQLQEGISLATVFGAVISGASHYGVVPIESSHHGTIHGVYRLVASHGELTILAELSQSTACVGGGGKSTGIDYQRLWLSTFAQRNAQHLPIEYSDRGMQPKR